MAAVGDGCNAAAANLGAPAHAAAAPPTACPMAPSLMTSPPLPPAHLSALPHRPQAKLSDDGKHVEVEVESEAKEDGRKEKKEVEYNVAI